LIGDAAGHVSPLTGGIRPAFRYGRRAEPVDTLEAFEERLRK